MSAGLSSIDHVSRNHSHRLQRRAGDLPFPPFDMPSLRWLRITLAKALSGSSIASTT